MCGRCKSQISSHVIENFQKCHVTLLQELSSHCDTLSNSVYFNYLPLKISVCLKLTIGSIAMTQTNRISVDKTCLDWSFQPG